MASPVGWWPFDPPEYTCIGDSTAQAHGTPPPPIRGLEIPSVSTGNAASPHMPSVGSASPITAVSLESSPARPSDDAAQHRLEEGLTTASDMDIVGEPRYILLCFDVSKLRIHGRFTTDCHLHQVPIMEPTSDREVFDLFRTEYYSRASRLSRSLSPKTLAHITFVKASTILTSWEFEKIFFRVDLWLF